MEKENVDRGKDQEERLFTQAEVDEIIKKRLERIKEKQPDADTLDKLAKLEEKTTELDKREFGLNCKSYLIDKGYDPDLLDIISADDLDSFKDKADRLNSMIGSRQPAPPLANSESINTDSTSDKIADAFSLRNKHIPKENY